MRKNMNKYAEVIVTYNRKKLLKENIEALWNQTFKDHDIHKGNGCRDSGQENQIL